MYYCTCSVILKSHFFLLKHTIISISESAYLQMDDTSTKMRPNMKRCIVILREVPDSTSVEVGLKIKSTFIFYLVFTSD